MSKCSALARSPPTEFTDDVGNAPQALKSAGNA